MADKTFICSLCDQKYLRADLKETCERVPIQRAIVNPGAVMVYPNNKRIYVIYELGVSRQEHYRRYKISSFWKNQTGEIVNHLGEDQVCSEEGIKKCNPASQDDIDKIKPYVKRNIEGRFGTGPKWILDLDLFSLRLNDSQENE